MNLETKITIYKFTPQLFTLTHPTGIETEQEHIPCKLQTGVQTQVQLFQLLDDFQGECPLDGLVDAGIYMLER